MRSLRAALFCAALRGAAPLRLGQRAARRGSTATSATAASLAPTAPTTVVPPRPSRIVQVAVRGKTFDVKRDDAWRLLGDFGAGVSGNKARKLFSFAVSGPRGCVVASLGGHQSNAMCALAALCHARGTPFVYLAKPVPKWLRQNPSGNYARALALGMELVPLAPADYARAVRDAGYRNGLLADVALSLRDESDEHQGPPDVEWVPQGAACAAAEFGVRLAADELASQYDAATLRRLTVVLPSGTGTTALFLARHLRPHGATVVAVPCATGGAELQAQMAKLDAASGNCSLYPEVLDLPPRLGEAKHVFGRPHVRHLALWAELRKGGLHVDLLYAPHAWDSMLRAFGLEENAAEASENARDENAREENARAFEEHAFGGDSAPVAAHPSAGLFAGRHVVYLHCGGAEGVATLLTRYRHAGLIKDANFI